MIKACAIVLLGFNWEQSQHGGGVNCLLPLGGGLGGGGGLVKMFSGPAATASPLQSETTQALALLGQEMVGDYIESDAWANAVESAVLPVVDGFLHRTLDPVAPVVTSITKNENATAEYIKAADEAVVDAIETSLMHPEETPFVLRDLSEILFGPVVEVAEEGVTEVRETVVSNADKNMRALAAPFQPYAHLIGKDNDVEAWIEAIDESLGNVIELQPLSEEAQALKQLRDTLMQPYYQSKLNQNTQIESDIQSIEAFDGGPESAASSGGSPPQQETLLQRYYRRFWELRNGLSGANSIDNVLQNGYVSNDDGSLGASPPTLQGEGAPTQIPMPMPSTVFQEPTVTKEHFASTDNEVMKADSLKQIRTHLESVLGSEVASQLLQMNPRFLLRHPHWVVKTSAQMMEENPQITPQEVADALLDLLRMKRMKQQARILTLKGCSSDVIEQKLKEFWIEKKQFSMKDDVICR